MITFDEFKNLDLKVARIIEVGDHPNADKLYIVKIDLGDEKKEVVAGIKKAYKPDELKGKLVIVVANLAPLAIRGVESNGMILAAQDGDSLAVVTPDKDVAPGSIVK